MMMIGDRSYQNPTVHDPPWPILDDPTAETFAGADDCGVGALYRFLPSNEVDMDPEDPGRDPEVYASDHFRMFEFKVRKCTRGRSHDWTECPYAHPGEKARRRDPRKFHYSGTPCPEFRKGHCKKGDACEYGHGVFECWLHPARYRTQPCKDGLDCRRRVCFFAHTLEQLRVVSPRTPDSTDLRLHTRRFPFSSESISPPPESPPGLSVMNHSVVESLRQLQLGKVKSMPCSWGVQMSPPGYVSPRFPMARSGFFSLPTTPTGAPARVGLRPFDLCEEEPVMERVESGRDLRAKMFEKLSRENFLSPGEDLDPQPMGPDVGWVSDLVN